jgi:hypothetical protein
MVRENLGDEGLVQFRAICLQAAATAIAAGVRGRPPTPSVQMIKDLAVEFEEWIYGRSN